MSRSAWLLLVLLILSLLYCRYAHGHWSLLQSIIPDHMRVRDYVTVVTILGGTAIVYLLYRIFSPSKKTIISRDHEDQLGYHVFHGRSKAQTINLIRQLKKAGQVPPIYPNSWYEVMRSEDLSRGEAKAVTLLEKHLVVFRSEQGRVSILDGYCPHLGANLGVGGTVNGSCIRCPFHGWEFDGETGKCVNIPYTDKVPSFAKTNVWNSMERNGLIWVWFDAEGREPPYIVEPVPQIVSKQWTYRGCSVHYVHAHIQDLCENAADTAHFLIVHGSAIGGGSSVKFHDSNTSLLNRYLKVNLKLKWEVLPPPNSHIGHTTIDSYYTVFDKWRLPFNVHADIRQVGPGFVRTIVSLPFAEGMFIQTYVPEGPMLVRMTSHLYFDWWVPGFIASHVLKELATQVDRDLIMWSNKTYLPKPLLVKEEDAIRQMRRWFTQFYTENSPRMNFKTTLDSIVW